MADTGIAKKSVARGLQLESRFFWADPLLLRGPLTRHDRSRRVRPGLKLWSEQAGFKNLAKRTDSKSRFNKPVFEKLSLKAGLKKT